MAPPPKRPKRSKIPKSSLSAARVLNANSPVFDQDIHGFITTTLSPVYWSQYTQEEKRRLIDLFPAGYRTYNVEAEGNLECPVSIDFLQSDTNVRASVAQFNRHLGNGCWEAKWQAQARKAMQERNEGRFDEYLREKVEEDFGETAEDQVEEGEGRSAEAEDPVEEDEERSESDWEQEHGTKEAEQTYVVERLLQQNEDGSRIEVKWCGYPETTWESRARLLEDVPEMVAALEAQRRLGLESAGSDAVFSGISGAGGNAGTEQVADGQMRDVVMDQPPEI
jgi:hypothetical protein